MILFGKIVLGIFTYLMIAGFVRSMLAHLWTREGRVLGEVQKMDLTMMSILWVFSVWWFAGVLISRSVVYFLPESREARRERAVLREAQAERERLRQIVSLAAERERAGDREGARQIRELIASMEV